MKPKHDSMRGYFAAALYDQMKKDKSIICLTADLGYGMLDDIRGSFRDRFINCGASEQAMLGIAVGIAQEGQIPFVYSITPFLLCRGFEWIRNYINHERVPVRMVGSGLNDDYKHDGITHHSYDAHDILNLFPNVVGHFPEQKEQIPSIVELMTESISPSFLCLRR